MSGSLKVGRFTVAVVPVRKLSFLEKNARYMTSAVFQRLVENVKQDGQLSQFPFCVVEGEPPDERYRVLSGNHRGQAAIQAGLEEIPIIFTDEPMSRQQQVAVQLSHNAIAGEDDPLILKELFDELSGVSERLYSGLDDKTLGLLAKVNIPALSEVRLDFRTLTFLFLSEEVDIVEDALKAGLEMVKGEEVYLHRMSAYDQLLDALAKTQAAYKVSNVATSLVCFLELFRRHMSLLEDGWYDPEKDEPKHDGWVPLATLFGKDVIPADAAVVIRRAIRKMVDDGDLEEGKKWLAIERLAADYLAGA